ncbi:ORF29 [Fowl aviadenovirus C]|uniref:ORF29 n=1 Tax=Fowl aviadenovirus C TaxID=190063 RepID=A0A2L1INX2_9ADEN|nr:ORF29 [Fowl aviadenovirus C]
MSMDGIPLAVMVQGGGHGGWSAVQGGDHRGWSRVQGGDHRGWSPVQGGVQGGAKGGGSLIEENHH